MSNFFVLCYALWGKNILPGLFVNFSGRVVLCYLFLLEESDCSRLGTLPFPLVFGFWVETISAGSGITVLLCGLKYVTCLSSAGVTLY